MPQLPIKKAKIRKLSKNELPYFKPHEIEVIKLVCRQYLAAEIGEKLGYTARTVEAYKADIAKKMKVRNAVGIAMWAVKNGLVKV